MKTLLKLVPAKSVLAIISVYILVVILLGIGGHKSGFFSMIGERAKLAEIASTIK